MWYYVQQKITVSIIVPVYNSEKYIARCLDSIVSQQGNFEVVIVNDGSTDSTQKIIDEYAQKHSNIKIITNKHNQGVSFSRNKGVEMSSSKYITFVDSDDWLEPNALKLSVDKIKKDKSDVVLTSYYDVYDREWVRNVRGEHEVNKVPEISKYTSRNLDRLELFSPFYAKDSHSDLYYHGVDIRGKFFSTNFIRKHNITFTEGIKCAEDIIFNFQIFLNNPKISILNLPIYNYYNRVDSVSKSKDMIKWAFESMDAMQQKTEYQKADRNTKLIIDDSLLSLINIATSNTIRQEKDIVSIIKELLQAYNLFNKYNIKERKGLRNYIKLHRILYGDGANPIL